MHYNIYDTISFVNISFFSCTVQNFVHAKYKPWTRYTRQFKCTFYNLYAQTFLKLKLHTLTVHSVYMAYIFNDRNSTFWHALISRAQSSYCSQLNCNDLLSERRQSKEERSTCPYVWGSWFTVPSSARTKRILWRLSLWYMGALIRFLKQWMSTQGSAKQGGMLPHKRASVWPMADCSLGHIEVIQDPKNGTQ